MENSNKAEEQYELELKATSVGNGPDNDDHKFCPKCGPGPVERLGPNCAVCRNCGRTQGCAE